MRISLELSRDDEGRLAGTVADPEQPNDRALAFSGIVQLVERIEQLEAESSPA